MRILVVDDNAANQESASLLTQDGHDVTVLGTIEEAFRFFSEAEKKGVPDVVMSDLWMPAPAMDNFYRGVQYILSSNNPYHPEHDGNRTDQIPAGLVFAIAAANLGVKRIAILTDSDHHSDQMVAVMDLFEENLFGGHIGKYEARYFSRNDEGLPIVKDWQKLLKRLLRKIQITDDHPR